MKSFIKEFKEFISRGNMVDLAVAVIIGGAFGKIVTSLVKDVIMPPIGLILGGVDFSKLQWVLKHGDAGNATVVLAYGSFLQELVNFLIIALCMFFVIKFFTLFKRKTEKELQDNNETELSVLKEIRDAMGK